MTNKRDFLGGDQKNALTENFSLWYILNRLAQAEKLLHQIRAPRSAYSFF
jgi:hypothetical protein